MKCFQGLVKVCGEYGILPSSRIVPGAKVQRVDYTPISPGLSEVWKGAHEGRSVAIKVIRHRKSDNAQETKAVRSPNSSPPTEIEFGLLQNFCREVATWTCLSHPNILELIGATMDNEEYTMVTPWMANGTVVEFLRENLRANPLKLARTMFHFMHPLIEPGRS